MADPDDRSTVAAFDHLHYVPVLVGRAAEFDAVRALGAGERDAMTPIWVIPQIQRDPRTDIPKKSLEAHLGAVTDKLIDSWPEPAFVDVHQIRDEVSSDGSSPASVFFDALPEGVALVPLIREDSTLEEVEAAVAFANGSGLDIGIRLGASVWADLGSPTADASLADLIRLTGREQTALHLIIDLADQVSSAANMSAAAVKGAMAELDQIDNWKTLTVLGTSMPATTADVGKDSSADLPRSEWAMWKLLRETRRRRMSFGDYAVQSVDTLSTFNPLYMQVSAQFRYTTSVSWFVARGSSTRTNGFAQAHDLAAEIVQHSEYSGRDFSWGDGWIDDCAAHNTTTGSAQTWRAVTTNHHLAFVISQLATLRGQSASA